MRRAALLALAVLAGCQPSGHRPGDEARKLLRTERYEEGLQTVEQALQARGADVASTIRLKLLKAELQLAKREARPALETLAFELPSGPEWLAEQGRQHLLRGHAQMLMSDHDGSRASLDKAGAIAKASSSPQLTAEVSLRQGSLAVRLGQFEQAEILFQHSLEYGRTENDAPLMLAASGNLGFKELRAGRYEDAIEWFDRTLALSRQLGARISEARALGNLGSAYYRLGDWDRALSHFSDAEKRFQAAGNQFEQQIWIGNQGNVLLSRRAFREADEAYRRALAISKALGNSVWTATWLSNLAQTSIEAGDWDAAERFNQEALELKQKIKDPQAQAYSWNNLARIAAGRGDLPAAQALYARAMAAGDPIAHLDAHAGLARVLAKANPRRADDAFRAALAAVERQRSQLLKEESKLSYFSSLISLYQDYVDFLMSQKKVEAALAVAEDSRGRVLSERFRQGSPRRRQSSVSGFQRVAADQDAVLLSYWLSPGRSYVWVVTREGLSAFDLAGESEIRHLVTSHNDVIEAQRDPLESEHPAGQRLAQVLIHPVRHLLAGHERVILVPDGVLHSLNFETLPLPDAPRRYLGEVVSITIAPWLGSLVVGAAPVRGPKGGKVLVMGNAASDNPAYPRLEFAGPEMAAIRASATRYTPNVLEGADATPEAYRAANPGQFDIIHFAAHAASNRENPLDSAVILSGAAQSGRLSARDLLATPLNADLVTISACRSVGARTYSGEGMVGLSWAFLRAGAHYVIASLWNVNDRSTAQLMSRLYRELEQGARPPDALHAAKKELLASKGPYRKPYYWASFQVYTAARAARL